MTAAIASPIAKVRVVLAVGTIPNGSTSLETDASKTISICFTKEDFILPRIPINGDLNSLRIGMSLTNSSVEPLFEIKIVGSPGAYIPRSP